MNKSVWMLFSLRRPEGLDLMSHDRSSLDHNLTTFTILTTNTTEVSPGCQLHTNNLEITSTFWGQIHVLNQASDLKAGIHYSAFVWILDTVCSLETKTLVTESQRQSSDTDQSWQISRKKQERKTKREKSTNHASDTKKSVFIKKADSGELICEYDWWW